MNNEIKVSVIVPVYNVEHYLRQSIQSILNQTLKEIEIILINDGSTDNSLSIMKELEKEDDRINIFSQPNNGQSVARNVGLIQAKGEYIYFFDSDDILEEKALEECYYQCKRQNLDFVFFNANVFSEDNISIQFSEYNRIGKFKNKIYIGTELLKRQLEQHLFSASVCLTFIKKTYLDEINLFFYPRIIHEDELFVFLLYLKAERITFIDKVYFHRRLRPNSTMTTSFNNKNIIGYLTVCRELKKTKSLSETNTKQRNIIKSRVIELLSVCLYKSANISLKDKNELLCIIKKEFHTYLNLKFMIQLYFPYIFRILKSIKNLT